MRAAMLRALSPSVHCQYKNLSLIAIFTCKRIVNGGTQLDCRDCALEVLRFNCGTQLKGPLGFAKGDLNQQREVKKKKINKKIRVPSTRPPVAARRRRRQSLLASFSSWSTSSGVSPSATGSACKHSEPIN